MDADLGPGQQPAAGRGRPARRAGAGVKRYLAGPRPDPKDVFARVASVVDHFTDFRRSLADQGVMCRFVACCVLATYLLDAFDVVGYLWPNGDKGSGKTRCLDAFTEVAYLAQLILAGSSYAALRDLAACCEALDSGWLGGDRLCVPVHCRSRHAGDETGPDE